MPRGAGPLIVPECALDEPLRRLRALPRAVCGVGGLSGVDGLLFLLRLLVDRIVVHGKRLEIHGILPEFSDAQKLRRPA